ncbi:MAG: lysophospholipid acyltransferase family protein [Bacteroidota bacterium]
MITAKPTWQGRFFWNSFVRISMSRSFQEIRIEREPMGGQEGSVLLIGNHISWWDGFFALWLNQQVFRKHYYVMMLEEELSKRRFMRQGGAFSINPGNRSIVESLSYTSSLLKNPKNLVVIFPQGKIHSQYETEIDFQPGIGKILDRVEGKSQVVFYAAHMDYLNYSKPILHFRLGTYTHQKGNASKEIERAYRDHFARSLAAQREAYKV